MLLKIIDLDFRKLPSWCVQFKKPPALIMSLQTQSLGQQKTIKAESIASTGLLNSFGVSMEVGISVVGFVFYST